MSVPTRSVAALDLGSNSFHMVVARVQDQRLDVVDRLKERVALAAGIDSKGNLDAAAQRRALACLARFGQRVREMPVHNVRAVGTNALRTAKNAREFLARAEAVLGHAIEVIPGREEARLIYLGVSHMRRDDPGLRLVVDIGGGSTECILGRGFEPILTDSLYMGSVTSTIRHFRGGRITRKAMARARLAARLEVRTIRTLYRRKGWSVAIGASGTILAVEQILRASGWEAGGITRKGLKRLREAMIDARDLDSLTLPGLEPERAATLPGGVAILSAILDGLGVERMETSAGALREGVLFDLLGRFRREDVRDRTIRSFSRRHSVDLHQAERVARTAAIASRQLRDAWGLDADARKLLDRAARLHEIGLSIAYPGYHRHGAYIVANADMPGFSRDEQEAMAALILLHRRKVPLEALEAVPRTGEERLRRLSVLLRLAVVLHRSRSARRPPALSLTAVRDDLRIRFPEGWLARHPLTRADLEEQRGHLAAAGFRLRFE